ncbi:MAG: NitT/TauT family transport system substrate-binding protein [Phenylobacterium sp.]|jgi:NitT/TauT family transport system substrate-binding protein
MSKSQSYLYLPLCIIVFCTVFLFGCGPAPKPQKVRIAINPWPGYEFLYLAAEKGMFVKQGMNVEIVELSSLADVQRVYIQGRVDGFGSTAIEAVQAAGITGHPVKIVLIPDFSFGGDVIIANKSITKVSELKGKRIGAEVGSLGMFVLHAALNKYGLSLDDVNIVNVEQLDARLAMKNNEIDAIVTYPPYSIAMEKGLGLKSIFDSSEIPGKVIDTLVIRSGLLENEAQWVSDFHAVWYQALEYTKTHQQEAYAIMAKREGVSVAEFADALTGLTIVTADEQAPLLASKQLKDNIADVCGVLKRSKAITFECSNINQLVQGYDSSTSK